MRLSPVLSLFALFAFTAAHSLHHKRIPTEEQIAREEIRAREHAKLTRNCEREMREYLGMRMRKRAATRKRSSGQPISARGSKTHYGTIQNTTCLTAPEVIEGPYYVHNEYLRSDIVEDQPGLPLLMDFGVMDTTTCKPMDSAFVEIWHANSTGVYGGYGYEYFHATETWLRGGQFADKYGMAEFKTIYPGFYDDRPPHIHLMVHKDMQLAGNGSFISESGEMVHVAQIFFPDDWSDKVFAMFPYTTNTQGRILNNVDEFYPISIANGYQSLISLEFANGKDFKDGLIGYITLGVDSRADYPIENPRYRDDHDDPTATLDINV